MDSFLFVWKRRDKYEEGKDCDDICACCLWRKIKLFWWLKEKFRPIVKINERKVLNLMKIRILVTNKKRVKIPWFIFATHKCYIKKNIFMNFISIMLRACHQHHKNLSLLFVHDVDLKSRFMFHTHTLTHSLEHWQAENSPSRQSAIKNAENSYVQWNEKN